MESGLYYVFSMIVSIAEQILIVAIFAAVFLFLLQLIKYFKNRNNELQGMKTAQQQATAVYSAAAPAAPTQPETVRDNSEN